MGEGGPPPQSSGAGAPGAREPRLPAGSGSRPPCASFGRAVSLLSCSSVCWFRWRHQRPRRPPNLWGSARSPLHPVALSRPFPVLKQGRPVPPPSSAPGVDRPPRSQCRRIPCSRATDACGRDPRGARHPSRGLRGATAAAGHSAPSWGPRVSCPGRREPSVRPTGRERRRHGACGTHRALTGPGPHAGRPSPGQRPGLRGPGPPAEGPMKEKQTRGGRESRGPRRACRSSRRHVPRGERLFLKFVFQCG